MELYNIVSLLVHDVNRTDWIGNKLLLKTLLAEAGSSPRAVELTFTRIMDKKGLRLAHEEQIQAIRDLSRSMADTRKNKIMLKLIRSAPGKKIVFVKYLGTSEHITDFLSLKKIPHAVFHGGITNTIKDE